ncbi:MAG: FAD-dependent oxidoreductase [Phycisphaerales bacterium]|nr:FAD-dependent oxidoreductase [Phycisphaerales bacterium]
MPLPPDTTPGHAIPIDALVVGGGIAGLWTATALRMRGCSVVIAESNQLGNGQTICAQGIVHGGLKYALGGTAGKDARRISDMPETWRNAIDGEADPLLSGARILSPSTWIWRTDSLRSRVGMLAARVGLKTPAEAVPDAQRPELLQGMPGTVLEVREPVLDMKSVLASFAARHQDALVLVDGDEGVAFSSQGGRIDQAILRNAGQQVTLSPSFVILAAGAGNASIRSRLGLPAEAMQRRPLHMCLVRGALPSFYGHCVDGSRTRVTITSTLPTDDDSPVVWQLGGQLAEDGVSMSPEELIHAARQELSTVLPSLPMGGLSWATYRIDRAERAHHGRRPDDIAILEDGDGHTLTCWPTKMALAPRLADAISSRIPATNAAPELTEALAGFDRPDLAEFPWETSTSWTEPSDARA